MKTQKELMNEERRNNFITIDTKLEGMVSAYVNALFYQGKKLFEKEGYRIISLEEDARLRVQEGINSSVSQYGNWVIEGSLYVFGKGKFITKKSPIITNAEEVTNLHIKGKDFYLNSNQVEEALSDSIILDFSRLPRDEKYNAPYIPTSNLQDEPISVYVFGEFAKEYGKFLEKAGINKIPIRTVKLQKQPFLRQVWFSSIASDDESDIDCSDWSLDYAKASGMRGIKIDNY